MLYKSEPMRSLVVEVETSSQVQGEVLQAAVDDVLKRAPYFGDALAEREGNFHYAKNPLPMNLRPLLQTTLRSISLQAHLLRGEASGPESN